MLSQYILFRQAFPKFILIILKEKLNYIIEY